MKKVLLLDIENQTKKLKELVDLLKQYHQIILVYATSNLMIALDDLTILSKAIQDEQLLLIKMPNVGANSADFGLTFIAGRLSATLSQGDCVDVMSNDKQMSYAVDLLKQVGIQSIQVKQVPCISAIDSKPLAQTNNVKIIEPITNEYVAVRPHLVRLKQYCEYLVKIKNNRPAKQSGLENSLKSVLKLDKNEQVKIMFNLLKKYKMIEINEQKIVYATVVIEYWGTLG